MFFSPRRARSAIEGARLLSACIASTLITAIALAAPPASTKGGGPISATATAPPTAKQKPTSGTTRAVVFAEDFSSGTDGAMTQTRYDYDPLPIPQFTIVGEVKPPSDCGVPGLSVTPDNAYSFTVPGTCDYNDQSPYFSALQELRTPMFDFSSASTITLRFWDFADVEDPGQPSCHPPPPFSPGNPNAFDLMDIIPYDEFGNMVAARTFPIIGDRAWGEIEIDLSEFADHPRPWGVSFVFASMSSGCNSQPGWWIDDISIEADIVPDPCIFNDTTAPVILDCPGDFTTTCNTSGGYNLDYEPLVDETCPYSTEYSWTNPLPPGDNLVSVTVTDLAGNSDTCEFTVTVAPITIICPEDIVTGCNSPDGYNLDLDLQVEGDCPFYSSQDPPNPLPFGTTEVTMTAVDALGFEDTCTFNVTVLRDFQDPVRAWSIPAEDGYVRQPDMVNLIEGPVVPKGSTFQVGDTTTNWLNRGILSFDTSALPADATVSAAYLRLTRSSLHGDPAGKLGSLVLDMGSDEGEGGTGIIGGTPGLTAIDYFDESAGHLDVASSFPFPAGNSHTIRVDIDPEFFTGISTTGRTQFRIRFSADNSWQDNIADYIVFHSGEAGELIRPEFVVEYYYDGCANELPNVDLCDGPFELDIYSIAIEDGGVGESHYTSGIGGSANSTSPTVAVGDAGQRQQQVAILSFDTTVIPEGAFIVAAEVRLFHTGSIGTPASTLGQLLLDIKNPYLPGVPSHFGTSPALEIIDFQGYAQFPGVASFTLPPRNQYTTAILNPEGARSISRNGVTQMRLRFSNPDDGDLFTDQASFATSNYGPTSPARPRLRIYYFFECDDGGGPVT